MREWALALFIAAIGHDFIGGEFFEHAFTLLMLPAVIVVAALLPILLLGLFFALIG